jgi:nucleoside recognition membrane protein YjiH
VSRKLVGLIVAALGLVVVFIAAAADVIGISGGSSAEMFGTRQIIGTVLGAVAVAAGLLVAFLPARPAKHRRKPAERPIRPVKHRKR